MSRKTMIPVLLLAAFVAAVLLSRDGGGADPLSERIAAPGVTNRSRPHRGLEQASWRTAGAVMAPAEDRATGYTREPTALVTDEAANDRNDLHEGIPDEVREKLAREYVGIDIAVASSPRDKEAPVRR